MTEMQIPRRVLGAVLVILIAVCFGGCERKASGSLLIAFPKSSTELRLVFSEPVDRTTAEQLNNYRTELGLRISAATVDPRDPTRVTLKTEAMPSWMSDWTPNETGRQTYADTMKVDAVRALGVRTASGASFAKNDSPRFVQGIPSVRTIQKPNEEAFPFASRLVALVATHEYNPDGGVPHQMIKSLGFMFLHRPSNEAPFNSIKIVTNKQVLGLAEAVADVREGKRQGLHVQWAGGEIQTVDC